MAGDNSPVEKLRNLLRDMKPDARAQLMAELERGMLHGQEMPGAALVLKELRESLRAADQQNDRISNPARLFFATLEPFLVDDSDERVYQGRIARACIEPIWAWICRDLAPAEAQIYSDEAAKLLLAKDIVKAEQAAKAFQNVVVRRFQETMSAIANDDKALRKFAGQVGTPHGLEDANQVVAILKLREPLSLIGSRLPLRIANLADDQLDATQALIDSLTAKQPQLFIYAMIMVMSRLLAPWQLIRLATKAVESDLAARIQGSPYAAAVVIVLGEVERFVRQLKNDLKRGRMIETISLLKDIHDAARGLRTEVNLSIDSPWSRQLSAARAEISDVLKSAIESVPGRVRRLLRPRPAKEIAPGSMLSLDDVAETEALIEFVGACRNFAGELAISEMTLRTYSELHNYLETSTNALVEGLRNAGASDRDFRQSQVDAAVRFCGKVFGADYAATLAKAAEVAGHSERKAAAKA
jgi:hypothetical protein